MLKRPEEQEFAPFYGRYIGLVPEGNVVEILNVNEAITTSILSELTEEKGNFRYEPNKWSLKEVIGHITDNERIMTYRLLRISRGDQTQLPGYDQDDLMKDAPYANWTLAQLLEDYRAVRQATYTLMKGIPDNGWLQIGNSNNSILSARSLAYVIAGHEIHHLNVLRERYLV